MSTFLSKIFHLLKNNLLIIVISLLIFSGLYWETLLKPGLIAGGDFYNFQLIFLQFLRSSFSSGQFPFWNPFEGGGLPMTMFSPIFYPFNLVYLAITNIKFYLLLFYLFHFLVAFFGIYFLSRTSNRSKYAGIVAAIIFTLSGFFAIRTYYGHTDLIAASSWIPLSFLIVKIYFRKQNYKYLLPLSFIFGLQILTGNLQIGYYSIIAVGLYFVSYLLFEVRKTLTTAYFIRSSCYFGAVVILGLGLTALSWLPTQLSAYFTTRGLPLNFDLVSAYSQPLDKIILMIFPPSFIATPNYEGINFIGLIPLILILVALFYFSHKWEVWFFAFLIFISLVVSAGNDTPVFYLLFKFLPGFANMRAHVRSLIIGILGVSILSAYGFDFFIQQLKDFKKKRSLANVTKFSLVLTGIILILTPLFVASLQHNFLNIYLISAGLILVLTVLFISNIIKLPAMMALLIIILIGNFYLFDWDYLHPVNYPSPTKTDTTIAEYIRSLDQNQKYKVWHDIGFNNNYLPKVFNFSQFGIHESQVTGWNWLAQSYMEFKGQKNLTFQDYAVSPYTFEFNKNILRLYGVRYLVSLKPDLEDSDVTLNKTFAIAKEYGLDKAMAYLYTFNNPYPLFYTQNDKILSNLVTNEPLNKDSAVKINSYTNNQIQVTVEPKLKDRENGYLVFNEIYFPGWRAKVNGTDAPVEVINYGIRGVKLLPGNNTITFYFLPQFWNLGVLITIISGLTVLTFFLGNLIIRKIKKFH